MAFVLSLFVLNLSFFGASGEMYFVTVAFPGYLHLYFYIQKARGDKAQPSQGNGVEVKQMNVR